MSRQKRAPTTTACYGALCCSDYRKADLRDSASIYVVKGAYLKLASLPIAHRQEVRPGEWAKPCLFCSE